MRGATTATPSFCANGIDITYTPPRYQVTNISGFYVTCMLYAEESDVKGGCSDHTEAEDVGYNTLLDLKRGDSRARVESFGQYLTRKWCGVFRD